MVGYAKLSPCTLYLIVIVIQLLLAPALLHSSCYNLLVLSPNPVGWGLVKFFNHLLCHSAYLARQTTGLLPCRTVSSPSPCLLSSSLARDTVSQLSSQSKSLQVQHGFLYLASWSQATWVDMNLGGS